MEIIGSRKSRTHGRHRNHWSLVLPLLLSAILLEGCVGAVVVGTVGGAGVVAAQERPVGQALDDTNIQLELQRDLIREGGYRLFNDVNIEVVEGRVLLTGNVPDPTDRITAARLAWRIDGVRQVANELNVADDSSVLDYFKDTFITLKIKPQLLVHEDVQDINYSIETLNGIVYVIGIARTQRELDLVHEIIRNTRGVDEVVSYVTVGPYSAQRRVTE